MVKRKERESKREEEIREEELRKYDYYDGKEGGSILTFFGGIILFCIGAFMIFQNTTISTGFGLSRLIGFDVPTGLIMFVTTAAGIGLTLKGLFGKKRR